MLRSLASRLLQNLAVLFVVLSLSFLVMKLAPGSPLSRDRDLPPEIEAMLGGNAADFYGFDRAALAPLVARIGPEKRLFRNAA